MRKPRQQRGFPFADRCVDAWSVAARRWYRIGRAEIRLPLAALRNFRHDDLNLVEVEVLGLERGEDELRERDDAPDHEELDDHKGDGTPVDLSGGERCQPLAGDAV